MTLYDGPRRTGDISKEMRAQTEVSLPYGKGMDDSDLFSSRAYPSATW